VRLIHTAFLSAALWVGVQGFLRRFVFIFFGGTLLVVKKHGRFILRFENDFLTMFFYSQHFTN